MRQVYSAEQQQAAIDPTGRPRRVTMLFVADPRRYNAPAVNEVAVVFVGDGGRPPRNLGLDIYDTNPNQAGHRAQNIQSGLWHADPMLYALFFPYGESG